MNRKIFMKFNVLAAVLLVTAVLSASPVAAQDFALGTVVGAPGELWEINLTTLATSFLTGHPPQRCCQPAQRPGLGRC